MITLLAGGVLVWIIARLLRRLRSRALALVLEKRFPELDDRLITAVEISESSAGDSPSLSSAMQRQTLRDAAATATALDINNVFDRRPLNRALFAAVLLAVSVAGFSIANASAVGRWYHAFVLGEDGYWDPFRRSAFDVSIVSQPGERLRPLKTDETFRHPRGADLVVRVDVPEDKVVPDQVTLHYRTVGESGSGRGRVTMTQIGDRTFRHSLTRAVDDHQLWIVGGDYTNRQPFRIAVVDAPTIESVRLRCNYPDYTGMDSFADQEVPVQGSQVSLPLGTQFVLNAQANKPLVGLRLRCPVFDLKLHRDLSDAESPSTDAEATNQLTTLSPEDGSTHTVSLSREFVEQWLSDDGDDRGLAACSVPGCCGCDIIDQTHGRAAAADSP